MSSRIRSRFPTVEIDGVTYEQKMDVTSLLMIGIDKAV